MKEGERIINKYPDKIPIKLLSSNETKIKNKKYIVSKNISVAQFLSIIKKINKINEYMSIILYIYNDGRYSLPYLYNTLENIYIKNKNDQDDLLYFYISYENCFG